MSQYSEAFNKSALFPAFLGRGSLRFSCAQLKSYAWSQLFAPILKKIPNNALSRTNRLLLLVALPLLLALLSLVLALKLRPEFSTQKNDWQIEAAVSLKELPQEYKIDRENVVDFDTAPDWAKRVAIQFDALVIQEPTPKKHTQKSVWVSSYNNNVQVAGPQEKSFSKLEELYLTPRFTPLNSVIFSASPTDPLKNESLFAFEMLNKENLRQCTGIKTNIFASKLGKRFKSGSSFALPSEHRMLVESFAKRYKLSPELILAIMRVESSYNPRALSRSNAVGLMQLVPKTAGWEAHLYLTGKKEAPHENMLFDPETNIEYGIAYLHLLFTRHFPDVTDRASRELCVIAAYNGGPNAVWRSFAADRNTAIAKINSLRPDDVYDHLTSKMATAESRTYVDKVLTVRNNISFVTIANANPTGN